MEISVRIQTNQTTALLKSAIIVRKDAINITQKWLMSKYKDLEIEIENKWRPRTTSNNGSTWYVQERVR